MKSKAGKQQRKSESKVGSLKSSNKMDNPTARKIEEKHINYNQK